jgi:hypothetical protein
LEVQKEQRAIKSCENGTLSFDFWLEQRINLDERTLLGAKKDAISHPLAAEVEY